MLASRGETGYRCVMTLESIKEAIEHLPVADQTALAEWLSERDWAAWDAQIERDFSPGGRGMGLLADLKSEIADGNSRAIEENCSERKSRRG